MMQIPDRQYPISLSIADEEVEIRPLMAEDRDAVLEFARQLDDHDLLFLRRDITETAVVDRWMQEVVDGEVVSFLALSGDQILGYSTLDRSRLTWSSHVGELRVAVAAAARGKGLGRLLTQEAFRAAIAAGIEKMIARMTLDQKGAIAVFEGLGFRPEALLKNHVKDRDGKAHDLVVMSHDVADFERSLSSYGVSEAVGGAGGA